MRCDTLINCISGVALNKMLKVLDQSEVLSAAIPTPKFLYIWIALPPAQGPLERCPRN